MRVRWRGLELPTRVLSDQNVSTPTYGRFMIEPFERGFGTTVGNSLRRILLSSLEGAAVTSIKIAKADHEFTSIKGVLEDVTDIVLNIKSLVVKSHSDEAKIARIHSEVKGPVTAGMIEADPAIEVIDADHHLLTLTDNVPLDMELVIQKGRGYQAADEMIDPDADQELGRIYVDASFSPVTRVRYRTEDTRVGQKVNYDRLVLEIWTNGTVTPEMAMVEAAKILRKHLNPFVQYFELGEQIVESAPSAGPQEIDAELQRKLNMSVHEMELSVRSNNCLEAAKIETVGQLARLTEAELLQIRSFGKTSLREVKRKLEEMGLSLGMNLPPMGDEGSSAGE
ncbi:MAG: DNA-directed RNA polymerase subunit alpha [Planctomycetaceae bacterium]|nr:DNA-directed RNA polymerase subunit alpha [Planctomycetaceae bacterium]